MENIIIVVIVAVIIFAALYYIYRSKKKGKKCIGCPYSSSCGKENHCSCGLVFEKEE